MLPLAAGAAVALGSFATSAVGQTWSSPFTGNWSDGTNWLGGVPPVSDPTTAVVFTSDYISGPITATNNLGSPFVVNSLTFRVNNAFSVSGTATANLFQLAGTSPSISMSGVGSATMGALGGGIQLTSDLTVNVAGPGNLGLSAVISDDFSTSNIHRALTISGGNPVRVWRLVTLGGANTFSGGLTLDGGAVMATSVNTTIFGASGTTLTVTPNGGTIGSLNTINCTIGTLQLNGDVHFIGGGGVTLFGPGGTAPATVVKGSGTLYCQNIAGAVLTMRGDSSAYTGAVVIDQSPFPNMGTALAGTLTLGAYPAQNTALNGSMNSSPSFDVRAGGLLLLDNNISNSLQNGDKIGNSTPVRLRSGGLQLNGPAPASTNGYTPTNLDEQIGTLSGAGHNTITINPTSTTNVTTTLEASTLARPENGTFNFRGTALGDNATLPRGRIIVDGGVTGLVGGGGAAATTNISILPYAVGGTTTFDNGTSLITYGADGFRPLTTSEYDTDPVVLGNLSPGAPTNNVRLTGATQNNASTTMNALVLANNSPTTPTTDGSVTGAGTLNITSGALIANPKIASSSGPVGLSNNVAFGNAEGIIFTVGTRGLEITGNLTGSNGLTKTGNGSASSNTNVLVLAGDNSGLTGPLTIDAGVVQFNSAQALPGTGTIVANATNIGTQGSAAALSYAGPDALTISRDIAVNSGYLTVKQFDLPAASQTTIGKLTLAASINGAGGINFLAQDPAIFNAGEIWVTSTGNTYTGATKFTAGTVHIAGDGSTGVGGGWDFASAAALTLEGDVTNSRHVNFEGTATIDTNGHNMTLNGPMTSLLASSMNTATAGGFTKNGAGTLTLANPVNLLPGAIVVNAGTLIVNGNLGASPTNSLYVAPTGTLGGSGTIYRSITVDGTLSPGNSAGAITTGNLTMNGTLVAEVNGTSAADLVNVQGTAGLGLSSTLSLVVTGTPSGPVIIMQNDGTDAVSGTFATVTGLPAGATINYAFSGTDSLGRVGDGNDIAVIFPQACYPNCDSSTTPPILNVADFTCFLQKYAAGNPYANCDHSTQPPVLNVADFTCFLQKYAAGCQ
jgi:autotransporter-associated beta strand protein